MFTLKYDIASTPMLLESYVRLSKKLFYRLYLPLTLVYGICWISLLLMATNISFRSIYFYLLVYSIILIGFFLFFIALLTIPKTFPKDALKFKPCHYVFDSMQILSLSEENEIYISYEFFNRFHIDGLWLIVYARKNLKKELASLLAKDENEVERMAFSLHTLSSSEIDDLSRFLANRIHR